MNNGLEAKAYDVMEGAPVSIDVPSNIDEVIPSDDELLAELKAMRGKGHPAGWYCGTARERFREINFELNRRGTVAPVFREMVTVPKGCPDFAMRPDGEKDLVRDLQVVDLDWIHQAGIRFEIDEPRYKYLFLSDEFDRNAALAFSSENWKFGAKLSMLIGLPEVVQCQLCCLVADNRRELLRSLKTGRIKEKGNNRREGGIPQHREKITQDLKRARKQRLVRYVDDWLKLWMVCRMLDQWTATSDVVQLYSLARGKAITADTVRASLRKVKEYLPFESK